MTIKELDAQYVAPTYARFPVCLVKGKGSLVYDENGKEYIDLSTGIAVNTFGVSDKTVFFVGSLILSVGGQIITLAATKMNESVKEEKKENESLLEAIFVLRHNKTLLFISLARILECVKLSVPWAYFFESQVFYKVGGIEIGGGTAQVVYGAVSGIPGTFAMLAATKIVNAVVIDIPTS